MSIFTRGFTGRRRDDPNLPPGQYLTEDFPVLSAGPTPDVDKADWEFTITTESGTVHRWNWDQFIALGPDEVSTDIHCVTRWSKFGTSWSRRTPAASCWMSHLGRATWPASTSTCG